MAVKLLLASHFCTTYFAERHFEKYGPTNVQSVGTGEVKAAYFCDAYFILHTFAYLRIKYKGKQMLSVWGGEVCILL